MHELIARILKHLPLINTSIQSNLFVSGWDKVKAKSLMLYLVLDNGVKVLPEHGIYLIEENAKRIGKAA